MVSGARTWIFGTASSSCANSGVRRRANTSRYEALTAIHWTHRVGALVTFLYLGALALALARTRSLGGYAAALAVALTVQVGLGIANVLGGAAACNRGDAQRGRRNFAGHARDDKLRAFSPLPPLHTDVPTVAGQHAGSRLRQFYAADQAARRVAHRLHRGHRHVPRGAGRRSAAGACPAATLGIALVAGAAAAINCLVEQKIDALMARTRWRPLPRGQITSRADTALRRRDRRLGLALLYHCVNALTMWLTLATFVGYAVVYTVVLKPMTPQNIVIGGASGAMPPVLGWAAVTGRGYCRRAGCCFSSSSPGRRRISGRSRSIARRGLCEGRRAHAAGHARRASSRDCTSCSTR